MNETLNHAIKQIDTDYTHVLEFGVNSGRTITQLKNQLKNKNYNLYGFDSFIGLPEDWEGTRHKKGEMSLNGVIPNIEGVKFFKGWFTDTIPEYIKEAQPIALLHVDCDLYSSTKQVLYGLKSYILPGTVLVFDEWYYNHHDIEENRQHEQKAFYEWVNDFNINFKLFDLIEDERRIVKIL